MLPDPDRLYCPFCTHYGFEVVQEEDNRRLRCLGCEIKMKRKHLVTYDELPVDREDLPTDEHPH